MKQPASLALPLILALGCDAQESPDYPGEPIVSVRGSLVGDGDTPDEARASILWYTSDDASCAGPSLECTMGYSGPELELDFTCAEACVADSCEPDALAAWTACVEGCGGVTEAQTFTAFSGCATGGLGETVSLSVDSFPAKYELDLFDAPPAAALLDNGPSEPRVAMGVIVALAADAPELFDFNRDADFETIIGGVESYSIIYAEDPIPAESTWGQFLGGAYDEGYHLVRYSVENDCGPSMPQCLVRRPEPAGFELELELRFAPVWELALAL